MNLAEVEIAELTEKELGEVQSIEKVSQGRPWSEASFRKELHVSFSKVLGARRVSNKRLLGYLVLWQVSDEIHILNVAVRPDDRRCGVGRQLMQAGLSFGRKCGAKVVYLEVRGSNDAAISLYKDLGFRVAQKRKGYYPDNQEDALVMECSLYSEDGVSG